MIRSAVAMFALDRFANSSPFRPGNVWHSAAAQPTSSQGHAANDWPIIGCFSSIVKSVRAQSTSV